MAATQDRPREAGEPHPTATRAGWRRRDGRWDGCARHGCARHGRTWNGSPWDGRAGRRGNERAGDGWSTFRAPGTRNGAVGALGVPSPVEHGKRFVAPSYVGDPAAQPVAQEWQRPESIATDFSAQRQRYVVSVGEYVRFHEQGFLIVKGLMNGDEVEELRRHASDPMYGRVNAQARTAYTMSIEEIEKRYLRIHMLHRHLEIEERYLLHPRILDVLEALIGPGRDGDGRCTSSRRRVAPGRATTRTPTTSPPTRTRSASRGSPWIAPTRRTAVCGSPPASSTSQSTPPRSVCARTTPTWATMWWRTCPTWTPSWNTLSRIAAKYPGREVPAIAEPGDVVFFGGHVLHRSHTNMSKDRFRRALVCHYGNARSFTMWGSPNRGEPANHLHILGRLDAPAVRSAPLRHALLPTNLAQPPTAPGWT